MIKITKKWSQMWSTPMVKHIQSKNMQVHILSLLNFVYIFVFDVETALQNAKLAILEQLELKKLLPSTMEGDK